ncbi:hypothetical protein WT83_32090 [Burkholderia territorii]|uniref:Uncharacterized protein n=1 Tax=Burkholderia territorii TaxID=1503055 RepID=A0A108E2U6_9BURK|nr:hypothetical protein [Burkholderia territorii]KWN03535.1 hypothetical protein WT83_32090 [Burkholderia territorii]
MSSAKSNRTNKQVLQVQIELCQANRTANIRKLYQDNGRFVAEAAATASAVRIKRRPYLHGKVFSAFRLLEISWDPACRSNVSLRGMDQAPARRTHGFRRCHSRIGSG